MEAAKESFAQRQYFCVGEERKQATTLHFLLNQVSTALDLLQHSLSQS